MRMTFWILDKSGEAEEVFETNEDDEDEEAVDVGRGDLPPYIPWLMVTTGYTATSRGGRCMMKVIESKW